MKQFYAVLTLILLLTACNDGPVRLTGSTGDGITSSLTDLDPAYRGYTWHIPAYRTPCTLPLNPFSGTTNFTLSARSAQAAGSVRVLFLNQNGSIVHSRELWVGADSLHHDSFYGSARSVRVEALTFSGELSLSVQQKYSDVIIDDSDPDPHTFSWSINSAELNHDFIRQRIGFNSGSYAYHIQSAHALAGSSVQVRFYDYAGSLTHSREISLTGDMNESLTQQGSPEYIEIDMTGFSGSFNLTVEER
ncbi:MAG: hypothetical protein ACQEQV_00980 [Fibrobacterota bacterium]